MGSINGFSTAREMLEALDRGEISSLELLDLHLRRIERYDRQLNAIVIRCFEGARQAAQAADTARAQGGREPLLGLPITLKESINVRGLQTTCGMPMWGEYRSEYNAAAAQRMQGAGAVLMGKTNVPPMLADWQSDNANFGRTHNPWDLSRTPGGSTGGGAAALAAGLTPLEVGSDIGGSIRVPAAFCGLYGHRPSETALPRSGQFPFQPVPNPLTLMGVQGPLARSAHDLELALDVLAGPEGGEEVAWRLEIPPARHARLADYRVAVLPPVDWVAVDTAILAAQDALIRGLERAGARVQVTQPEVFGDLKAHHMLYRSLLAAITGARNPEPERRRLVELHAVHGDEFSEAHCRGLLASVGDYFAWHAQRQAYRAAYREFFKTWDILLAPITLVPAFPHVDMPWPRDARSLEQTVEVNGRPVPYDLQLFHPALATLSGQPATAFPVGLTGVGLPIGLQAIGPYLEDRTPIHFAALVGQEFGGFRPPLGYDAD